MASQIQSISDKFREDALARNEYKSLKSYNTTHPNALSDGDESGKGDNNGKIGSSVDIQSRLDVLGRNTYTETNGYGTSHENALSDGDELGRGETTVKLVQNQTISKDKKTLKETLIISIMVIVLVIPTQYPMVMN